MKTLVTLLIAGTLLVLASCSKPIAKVYLENQTILPNQSFTVKNLSSGGEVTYIKMNGDGIKDGVTPVSGGNLIQDLTFSFRYNQLGSYSVEVSVESSSIFGGTEITSSTKKVTVAYPAEPKPIDDKPVGYKMNEKERFNNNESDSPVASEEKFPFDKNKGK